MRADAAKRSTELRTGLAGGPPLGVVIVWALNAYVLPSPMPAEIAVAVGSVVTTAVAAVARIFERRNA
jgi:hypothetical protein